MVLNVGISPQQIQFRRQLGQGLVGQGLQPQARTGLGALGQMAQTFAGALLMKEAGKQEAARRGQAQEALAGLFQPQTGQDPLQGPTRTGAPLAALAPSQPTIQDFLRVRGQFPELAGTIDPLIAGQLTPQKPIVAAPGSQVFTPRGQLLASVPAAPKAPKLREIFDPNSPTGTRLVPESEAVGQPGKSTGLQVVTETLPDGRQVTRVATGGAKLGVGGGNTKATETSLQKSLTQSAQAFDRLQTIADTFDERLLTWPEQLRTTALAGLDKLGVELSPEQTQSIERMTEFQTATLENLNTTLNQLSGAAVSPAEAERIKGALPNADDSPAQFRAKMRSALKRIRTGIERTRSLSEQGVTSLQFNKQGELINGPALEQFNMDQLLAERPGETDVSGGPAVIDPETAGEPVGAATVPDLGRFVTGGGRGGKQYDFSSATNTEMLGILDSLPDAKSVDAWEAEMKRRQAGGG